MSRILCCLSLVVAVGSLGGGALAKDTAEYQRHYDRARELVRVENLRGAIREFEAAYSASPRTEPLFNIGLLYRDLAISGGTVEDAQRSIDAFQQYLDRHSAMNGTNPPNAKTVERYIAELRASFSIPDSTPAPQVRRRSDRPRSSTEAREEPVRATAADVSLPTPQATAVPEPAPAPTGATPAPANNRRGLVASIAVGAAAVLLLGVGLGVYDSARSDYESSTSWCTPRCDPSSAGSIKTKAYASYALLTLGGIAAAADAALWIAFAVKRKETRRAVSITPGFGTVSVRGEW